MTETKVNSSKKKEEEKQNSKKSGRHVNLQISYVNPIKGEQIYLIVMLAFLIKI